MTRLLVLNHRGVSVDSLVDLLTELGASMDLFEPESFTGPIPFGSYDGVIASGGYLKAATRKETLAKYSEFFERLKRPYLGICLGMKILGFCYGARMGRTTPVVGGTRVSLVGFPLCPDLSEFTVHQNHRYELLAPLPDQLRNFTAAGSPVEAVKVVGRPQYAVQFHPEVGDSPAKVVVKNFVSMCAGGSRATRAQGT